MAQPQAQNTNLFSELGLSLALHLAVLALIVFKVAFFPSEPIVVENAIRVDLVALPDKIPAKRAEPPAPAKVTPKPVVPVPEKLVEKPATKAVEKAQNAAIERIKALQEIEKQVQAEEKQTAKAPTYKGLRITPGTLLTGVDRLQHEDYQQVLDSHVKQFWVLPQWLKNSDLNARILVKIDASGQALSKQITRSSGDPIFDEKVMEAIDRALPFPKPPDKFVSILEVSGVEFGFPN